MRLGRTFGWILVAALVLACVGAADAKDKKKSPELSRKELKVLKVRFKKRHRALLQLKKVGTIGETSRGHVEAVKPKDVDLKEKKLDKKTRKKRADLKKLLDEENGDRDKIYKHIAHQQKVKPASVAKRSAKRKFVKAKVGEYLKHANRKWQKKPAPKKKDGDKKDGDR